MRDTVEAAEGSHGPTDASVVAEGVGRGTRRRTEDGEVPVSVLADETALSVLTALDEPRTAREVADECGVGLSTAYRKLERLAETPLCEERVTVRSDGCRVSRYCRVADDVRLDLRGESASVEPTRPSPAPVSD